MIELDGRPAPASPYPGLRPFRRDEADVFFGREEQVQQLSSMLRTRRFVSVVGSSGCGKSSLVRAGLIPQLEESATRTGEPWAFAHMRPGEAPILRLAEALLRQQQPPDSVIDPRAAGMAEATLRRGRLGLVEAVREWAPTQRGNLLLMVDQFEEIFRFRREQNINDAEAFVDLLLAAVRAEIPSSQTTISVVITMRSDFLGNCDLFTGLPEAMIESQFLTPRLTRAQRIGAIRGPALLFNSEIDPRLCNRLANEAGLESKHLPMLQHLMMRMWDSASARSGAAPRFVTLEQSGTSGSNAAERLEISLDDYEAVGGLEDAISQHGDALFEDLSLEQQHIAETMFRCLCEQGTEQQDIRRPTRLAIIAEIAGVTLDRVISVANVFRDPKCSFLSPPPSVVLDPDSVLDIIHESLIRKWKRLAEWVEAETKSADNYRRVLDAARRHQDGEAALWREPDLTRLLAWRDAEHPNPTWAERYGGDFGLVEQFMHESESAQAKGVFRDGLITLGLAVAIAVLLAVLGSFLLPRITLLEGHTPSRSELIRVMMAMGAIGALLRSATSFVFMFSLGNARLDPRWVPYYLLLPVQGALLGLIVYLVIDGAIVKSVDGQSQLNYLSIYSLAFLVGFGASEANRQLQEAAKRLFGIREEEQSPDRPSQL